jgi:hypothetical protein
MNIVQIQLPPAAIIAAMIALAITIAEILLPIMLRIIKPIEGASYQQDTRIPLKVYVPKPVSVLRFFLFPKLVKWYSDGKLIAYGIKGRDVNDNLPGVQLAVGNHIITVEAPGFIPAQVTIEVVPVIVYSPLPVA